MADKKKAKSIQEILSEKLQSLKFDIDLLISVKSEIDHALVILSETKGTEIEDFTNLMYFNSILSSEIADGLKELMYEQSELQPVPETSKHTNQK